MNKIRQWLRIVFEKNTKHDWDTWICVCGDEGIGKTNLNLQLMEDWYNMLYGEVKEEHIKHLSLSKEDWKKDLSQLKQYECSVYDEGGELNNRRTMSKFNVEITQLARVIRGDNNLVILTIQDFFDIDPFFSKRRIRALLYVYKRGRVAVYSRQKVRNLAMINKYFYIKNYWIVQPTITDTFGIYNGVLRKAYNQKKKDFLIQSKLKLNGQDKKGTIQIEEYWLRAKSQGVTDKQIGFMEGLSPSAVTKRVHKYLKEKTEDVNM